MELILIKFDFCKIEIVIFEFSEFIINLFLMKKVGVYKKYILWMFNCNEVYFKVLD